MELKEKTSVNLTNGGHATVIKELGRGGQGIVYLVDVAGKRMALKWYLHPQQLPQKFYKNLEDNIAKGAPSEAFLWPEYLTKKEKGSFGYVMRLRPQGYYEFGHFLLARKQFGSFEAILNAAMKICDGFRLLHLHGLSYQDLNDGNFFIDPKTGDVLICDNDNVMPDGQRSGIMGKARYMAPEVVAGHAPDKYSDRFSLSVILFMLFYGNHPLEGSRVLACPCMTEEYEKKFYGSEAQFIFDPKGENRPVRGVHNNVIRRWPALPSILRDTFSAQFSQELLTTPEKRLIENQWRKVIQSLRDALVICPSCMQETFLEGDSLKCMNCGKAITPAGYLDFGGRKVALTVGSNVYINSGNDPDIAVIRVADDRYPIQLKNITNDTWVVETPSGKIKQIAPQSTMPVKPGLKVTACGVKILVY
ncbi:MAG: serine/threonine-protein kinase [Bacteroidales bacterium]|nr:serine/threonine-protein kinase [Bacteroidales bacterium]